MRERRDDPMHSPDADLAAAGAALDAGRVQEARELANAAAQRSQGINTLNEARALAFMAHCDRVGSRLRRAAESSRRAAQLFEQVGDMHGEAGALITLTHVCMLLGRNEEAVEAALLAVFLCDQRSPQPQTVLAHNCLGLAYSWSGDHERGDAALQMAVEVAGRCIPPASIYQPRLNQVFIEASRLLDERYQTGRMQSLQRLQALLQDCWQLERAGAGQAMLPGLRAMARTISFASSALLAAWQGELGSAKLAIDAASASLIEPTTWLDCFVRWCTAEWCWAQQDWAGTERELTRMKHMALAVEHEQLACRAQLLLAQVFELQGKNEAAHREYRALRQRERRVVADGLSSRESLVSWQLGARQTERHLQQALTASRQFERWSLEDALTGIANRRHFEQTLADRLPQHVRSGRPLSIAMVDLNDFKSVNDRYGHHIGDRVLKTVAAIMSSQVRDEDLPARWAGDEFVILFGDATEPQAKLICERLQAAVAGFAWESIAPGLQMSVSIGLSQAGADDSAESVVHRSDESMYRAKGTRPGHGVLATNSQSGD